MSGDSIDNTRFFEGGSYLNAFMNASNQDFWLKSSSILIGKALSELVPTVDFNGTSRVSLYDVGAYETEGLFSNPGWKISTGFKGLMPVNDPPSPPGNLRIVK
jgi:hypothetical protein